MRNRKREKERKRERKKQGEKKRERKETWKMGQGESDKDMDDEDEERGGKVVFTFERDGTEQQAAASAHIWRLSTGSKHGSSSRCDHGIQR
jgi:hypothetical protein